MIGDDSICQSQSISSNYNSINNDSQTSAQNLIQMCFFWQTFSMEYVESDIFFYMEF